ncbi:hypothetical protein CYMTET_30530 [Cymbomonas tetramitiformis]|uniref:Methenyltetrahydrofolate cyclohydrolase n=1 Tax=Cymbomonas tetramitiformis TaxID=36881 RepID=A0AAE0FIM0_9CHLO|nr:hypothetical protein CYMTET_30530 [Cymbomonas tetramitiformis]
MPAEVYSRYSPNFPPMPHTSGYAPPAIPLPPIGFGSNAKILDGVKTSKDIRAEVATRVEKLKRKPALAVILVGKRADSLTYVRQKMKAAEECNILAELINFEEDVAQDCVVRKIEELNLDTHVDGILVQLPLPPHLKEEVITVKVADEKDVDGLKPSNMGRLAMRGHEPLFVPCTPMGVIELLHRSNIELRGKEAVIIGASNIVGLPMSLLLLKEGCTVTICHIDTMDVAAHARQADVVVVGVGKAGLVRGSWIKRGATVIDVGINVIPDPGKKSGRRIVGDVHEEVFEKAGYITPVPGGVGPMTVAMLMKNTCDSAARVQA